MNTSTQKHKGFAYLSDFIAVFFPKLCLICQQKPMLKRQCFCFSCQQKLPLTNFHLTKENSFTERFWGRLPLEAGAALFYFRKDSKIQQLIYQLKYGDRPKIGVTLGRWYGSILKKYPIFLDVDIIVPVPLHPIRKRKRGYNQSTQFAIGLSESLHIHYNDVVLKRTTPTTTQTKKTRVERFDNVLKAFQVSRPTFFENKHILLVDDVLTTGATLEACAIKLLAVPNVKISMATIAIAME